MTQVSTVPVVANASEAVGMIHAGLRFLAAAAATAMAAAVLTRSRSGAGARGCDEDRGTGLDPEARSPAAQGCSANADYSPRSWLIPRTQGRRNRLYRVGPSTAGGESVRGGR